MAEEPEQVLASTLARKRVAFEIEEQITGIGRRQAQEAGVWLDGKQVERRHSGLALAHLELGLMPQALVRRRRASRRREVDRRRQGAQRRECSDAAAFQFRLLDSRQAGDK